jgi:hypothetical protein
MILSPTFRMLEDNRDSWLHSRRHANVTTCIPLLSMCAVASPERQLHKGRTALPEWRLVMLEQHWCHERLDRGLGIDFSKCGTVIVLIKYLTLVGFPSCEILKPKAPRLGGSLAPGTGARPSSRPLGLTGITRLRPSVPAWYHLREGIDDI